ncbi:MAG: helix-turn-helix transcriptional regulator [Alphaproteobacteria bacterium]|nr:helix-turn-helix transcriptional regulator [Alphaproteobacteria bacterium]
MKMNEALSALGALAQETRLEAFRTLIRAGQSGLPAGDIAQRLGVGPTVMSFHLTELSRAGLIGSRREGRSIIYTASFARIGALLDYLIEDCCLGACGTRATNPKESCCEADAR